MKYWLNLFLVLALSSVCSVAKAQIPVRPYGQWEATQFVAVSVHQPEDYVTLDNNWEILYNLRTPHTLGELRGMGVKCSDSQLLLLKVGGLISKAKGKWQTTIPILDQEQTRSLRSFSEEVAGSMYAKTKSDFISLTQTIHDEMGFKDNALSLIFSYLLDGRMWTKLVLFDDIDSHFGWSGCYWVLYEPRTDLACGTNSYGEQDLILTYVNSDIVPNDSIMERYAEEIAEFGKITDTQLVSRLKPYGLVDDKGDVLIPIIKRQQDRFHQITDKLVDAISAELKSNCNSLATRYGIKDEKVAMVILYHEVMWNLVDKLIQDQIIAIPSIFKNEEANKSRLNEVLFFIEGGLMQ